LKDIGERREWSLGDSLVRKATISYIYTMHFSLQNTRTIALKPHSDLGEEHNYHYFPVEESVTQKCVTLYCKSSYTGLMFFYFPRTASLGLSALVNIPNTTYSQNSALQGNCISTIVRTCCKFSDL
jgi:hypothetical protein